MKRPDPVLPDNERTILLEIYQNPATVYDTFRFTDKLYFPNRSNPRNLPEYAVKFKDTLSHIESLVEQGLIDGTQLQHVNLGMYYSELKIKFKGKQAAIRGKRQAEKLENALPDIVKRSNEVQAEMIKAAELRKKE